MAERSKRGGTREGPEAQRVLVADGNTGRGQRLVDECTTAGYPCKLAPHGAAALEVALATQPGLVVAQIDLPLVDAFKLAEILRANPRTRTARFLFLGAGESLGSRGEVGDRILASDTRPAEIVGNIEELFERQGRIDALDSGAGGTGSAAGNIANIPLADLLQTFLLDRRSGRLELSCADEMGAQQRGILCLRNGDVVMAEVAAVEGEKALFRMLAWRQGTFSFEPGEIDAPPMILAPTRRLLVEGLRQLEEWDRLAPQLPPMGSPVKLNVKNSELPNIVHPLTQEVLLLLELYGTVREIVDRCAYPDYQVLRTLHTLTERGIIQLRRAPTRLSGAKAPADRLFGDAQVRRLRDWLGDGVAKGAIKAGTQGSATPERQTDAKLLVVASCPDAISQLQQLLSSIPGVELPSEDISPVELSHRLQSIGRVAVDGEIGVDLVHLPTRESFSAFWPVAGYGALGTLLLLSGPVGDAALQVESVAASLSQLPRARTFHVVLLDKDERISPDELRDNLSLIDEASLFLLPVEGGKDPAALLRSLFARVLP